MEGSRRITHINFVFFSEGQCVNNSMAAGWILKKFMLSLIWPMTATHEVWLYFQRFTCDGYGVVPSTRYLSDRRKPLNMTQHNPVFCITQTQLTFIVPTTHEQTLTYYIENAIIIIYEKDVFQSVT